MPTVTLVQNGFERAVIADKSALLSSVLGDNGAHLDMPCGGGGICGKCLVKVDGTPCLACQTRVGGDIRVELEDAGDIERVLAGTTSSIRAKAPMYAKWGLSIDVGTTTICAELTGADGSSCTETRKNPQTAFGADVISRIEKSLAGDGERLAACITKALREMIGGLCASKKIRPDEIDAAVITGNTAMLYLMTGQSPKTLSHAPFNADRLFGEYLDSRVLGLGLSDSAKIYLPRCMAAFVGGDITTAILASGMCEKNDSALLVDIGTNGELALWHGGKLSCASTAAGPAFEGGGISCGVYGINGAIDRVWIEDATLRATTIGGGTAVGICGSGIVDALAAMLTLGVVDETGALDDDDYEIIDGIRITARDIRSIQLAKGSIRAGIETLLETSGIPAERISSLYLAGGFGNYLNLENAAAIGLIPESLLPAAISIGNAAHTGAAMLLSDKTLVESAESLAKSANIIALDANPIFTDNYMRYMMFE